MCYIGRCRVDRGEAHNAGGKVLMLADPHLELTKALGITLDAEGLLGTKR